MTIKKLAVTVATMAVVTGSLAVPAMAQQQGAGQYAQQGRAALLGQQAPQGQAISVTGIIERLPSDGGPAPYGVTDEASGVLYVLDGGEGSFSAYEGQRVTIQGTAQETGAGYRNLEVSDVRAPQGGGDPMGAGPGEQVTITGLFSVKEGGWSFVTDETTGQDYYLVGAVGLDPEKIAGKRVVAEGVAECGYDGPVYGCTLAPSSITPVGKVGDSDGEQAWVEVEQYGQDEQEAVAPKPASANDNAASTSNASSFETTAPAADVSENTASGAEQANEKTAAVVSGDASDANKGGSGSASASGGGAVQGGASSAVAKVLPSSVANVLPDTGGILPVAGAAGALLIAAGLMVRRIFR